MLGTSKTFWVALGICSFCISFPWYSVGVFSLYILYSFVRRPLCGRPRFKNSYIRSQLSFVSTALTTAVQFNTFANYAGEARLVWFLVKIHTHGWYSLYPVHCLTQAGCFGRVWQLESTGGVMWWKWLKGLDVLKHGVEICFWDLLRGIPFVSFEWLQLCMSMIVYVCLLKSLVWFGWNKQKHGSHHTTSLATVIYIQNIYVVNLGLQWR